MILQNFHVQVRSMWQFEFVEKIQFLASDNAMGFALDTQIPVRIDFTGKNLFEIFQKIFLSQYNVIPRGVVSEQIFEFLTFLHEIHDRALIKRQIQI